MAPLPPLVQAHATLSLASLSLASIDAITDLISAFLDGSVGLRPPQAAASRSARLVDRVFTHAMADAPLPRAWRSHWFSRAMEIALTNDDLVIAKKVHAVHPEPLAVRSLEVALRHSTVETVQWVVENRNDRLCCPTGIKSLCRRCSDSCIESLGTNDTKRVVEWLAGEGALVLVDASGAVNNRFKYLLLKDAELLQWCFINGWVTPALLERCLLDSLLLGVGDAAVIRFLVEQTRSTSDEEAFLDALACAACNSMLEEAMEIVTASHLCDHLRDRFIYAPTQPGGSKVLQWEANFLRKNNIPNVFSAHAMAYGRLDTLRWLVEVRGVRLNRGRGFVCINTPEQCWLDVIAWMSKCDQIGYDAYSIMSAAARKGYVELMECIYSSFTPDIVLASLMDEAATHGHLHVLQWLYQKRSNRSTPRALYRAAESGHLHVVQWLHTMGNDDSIMLVAMAAAAQAGQLEVLTWLYERTLDVCLASVIFKIFSWTPPLSRHRRSGFAMLHCLKWLDSKRNEPHEDPCVGCAMARGVYRVNVLRYCVAAGNLALMEYVEENHHEVLMRTRDPPLGIYPSDEEAHPGVVNWLRHMRQSAQRNGETNALATLN